MLDKSIIVSAHPDDEILWFSSIAEKVDKIVFCFSDCDSHPDWSTGREKSLSEYPIKNITQHFDYQFPDLNHPDYYHKYKKAIETNNSSENPKYILFVLSGGFTTTILSTNSG